MALIRICSSAILLFALAGMARGEELGVFGATYPVAEPDALEEIQARAKEVNWGAFFNDKKMKHLVESYKPAHLKPLPRAKRGRTFTVDLTATLDQDIPDGKGGTLYPRGYRFNPLEYVSLPSTLVILNGEDPGQVRWFKTSRFSGDVSVLLLLSDGAYQQVSGELKRSVYYAPPKILERLRISALPAVASQKGRVMEVEEIVIDQKKN